MIGYIDLFFAKILFFSTNYSYFCNHQKLIQSVWPFINIRYFKGLWKSNYFWPLLFLDFLIGFFTKPVKRSGYSGLSSNIYFLLLNKLVKMHSKWLSYFICKYLILGVLPHTLDVEDHQCTLCFLFSWAFIYKSKL